jgi:hypothetical protein
MSLAEHRGISVVVEAGYQIPDAYLTSLFTTKPNVFGAMSVKKDGGLELSVHSEAPTLSKFKALNKAFESKRYIFFVGNYPEGYLSDSVQPFRMLAEDGKALVAATLVGDFKKHRPSGEGNHSDEFFCAHTILMGKVEQFYRICKGDHKMFWDELDSTQSKKDVAGLIGLGGGQITLMFQSDDGLKIRHYQKSISTYKKFTWGDTTNVLDYVSGIETGGMAQPEAKDKPEPTTDTVKAPTAPSGEALKPPAKKPNKFAVEDDDEEEVVPTHKTTDTEVEDNLPLPAEFKPIEVITHTGTILRNVMIAGKEAILAFQPIDMTKRKLVRRWAKEISGKDITNKQIEDRVGLVPKDPAMVAFFLEAAKRTSLLGAPQTPILDADAPRHKNPDATAVAQGKNAATGQAVEVVTNNTTERPAEELKEYGTPIYTVLNNKDKYDTNKYLKTLDKNGQAIINPNNDEDENTIQQFYKAIDYPGIEQTFGWRAEWRYNLARVSPRAMAIWSGDLLRVIRNLSRENEVLKQGKDDDETEVTFNPKRKSA